jgi:heme-degrading monooxygenase HmoA
MSVVVIARFPVADVANAKQALASQAALLDEVSEDAKKLGCEHHRFVEGDGELVVIDEWQSAEGFQRFFEANPKVQQVTESAGVQGPPNIAIFRAVEAAGTF